MKVTFFIKVTPLGANLCLLEESEEGEIRNLIREGKYWWSQWFTCIREWNKDDIDNEIVAWIRVLEYHAKLGTSVSLRN